MLQLQLLSRFRNNLIWFSFLGFLSLTLTGLAIPTVIANAYSFTAQMLIGGDITPPTKPDPMGAVAVSASQIDLVWGVSDDDTGLGGYRVWRDGIQIATTTLTTFSDSGLDANTAYTYYVDAFDIFYNYSINSDLATITTLEATVSVTPPAIVPATPSTGGLSVVPVISSVLVIPKQFSASLQWTTNVPTTYVIKWGRTDSYELGSVSGSQLLFTQQTIITNLELATKYFYEIEGWQGNTKLVSTRGYFTTTGNIPTTAIPNVRGLQAKVEGESIRLWWQNPELDNFSHVRIVRSHLFYPQYVSNGRLVYEGPAEEFLDKEALVERPVWYYTIFVFDQTGQVASGATILVKVSLAETLIDGSEDIPLVVDLFAMNVALDQGGVTSYLHNPDIFFALEPLFVSIPVAVVPRQLKSIIVTITNPSQQKQSTSYLLKINPAGTAYQTLLPPVLEAGQSQLTVTLYNYELATVRIVSNYINFTIDSRSQPVPWWVKALIPKTPLILFLLLGLVLFWWRWREEKRTI